MDTLFPNYGRDVGHELGAVLRSSDIVLFTNAALQEAYIAEYELQPTRCHYLSHGVGRTNIKADVALGEAIEAVYVGAINGWLDWDWLSALVAAVPQLRITFYGPCERGYAERLSQPAYRYGGIVGPERLPDLLSPYHFGLIPFPPSPLKRFSEPMKLYDYIAAGLPTISLMDLDPTIQQSLPAGIKTVVDAAAAAHWIDRDPAFYALMRGAHARDCRRFVREHSWDRRAETVAALLTRADEPEDTTVVPFRGAACA